jgi:CheY-like chemotaxis protein
MDGFEATRQIRRLEAEQKSPSGTRPTFVTALTGLASASDEEAAFNAGVDMYLTKPVQFPRLSTLLRECEEGTLKTSRALDES